MKKVIIYFTLIAFTFLACNKEQAIPAQPKVNADTDRTWSAQIDRYHAAFTTKFGNIPDGQKAIDKKKALKMGLVDAGSAVSVGGLFSTGLGAYAGLWIAFGASWAVAGITVGGNDPVVPTTIDVDFIDKEINKYSAVGNTYYEIGKAQQPDSQRPRLKLYRDAQCG